MKILKSILCLSLSVLSIGAIAQVNINTATSDELSLLKGIGKAKAKAIIEYRESNGDFANIDDLSNIKGIGNKIIEGLKDDVILEGESNLDNLQ